MTGLDWVTLVGAIGVVAGWGVWLGRGVTSAEGHLRGGGQLSAWTIGLSVMATQASAITFLSLPGQAWEDGMRFGQFYLGLPLAMIVICVFLLPVYHRLNVYTAYEYLEHRFDVRVRLLTAGLFLVQRGLAAGISLYAPAIVLSAVLGWSLEGMVVVIGLTVIAYTVSGGSAAVSRTQRQQMVVILLGMAAALGMLVRRLPEGVGLDDAAWLAGQTGRMNLVTTEVDPTNRYTLWSGLIGGFFLALSYFGTDQSQVQRYLATRDLRTSRMGLLLNGAMKVPMQYAILFVGVLVFVFHVFEPPPLHMHPTVPAEYAAADPEGWARMSTAWESLAEARTAAGEAAVRARGSTAEAEAVAAFVGVQEAMEAHRLTFMESAARVLPGTEVRDTDYVFIRFVLGELPAGLVGLLIAVILMAAMSSTASELNALGTTTVIDFYRRLGNPEATDGMLLRVSRLATVFWGFVALGFALFASLLANLIEAVNILGSLFYGPMLGIFVCALGMRRCRTVPVLVGALAGEATVLWLFWTSALGFLWYNLVGCMVVVSVAWVGSEPAGPGEGESTGKEPG